MNRPRHVVVGPEPGRHLVLVGPTAAGKTGVSVELARRRNAAGLPTEVISCDSMQVYRGMDIGTDKVSPEDRRAVAHHMLDLVDPTEEHNLADFLAGVRRCLVDIESRGASAVVVGGTGLYVRGVVDGFDPPPHFPEESERLSGLSTEELTDQLGASDPVALSRIPPGNRRRLIRALEVIAGTGRAFSDFGSPLDEYPQTPFLLCGLSLERSEITRRIHARYERQIEDGLLEEVLALHALGGNLSRTASQALGYREILAHLRGESTLPEALERARTRTRRFAVRQLRWFRRDPRITWLPAPLSPDAAVDANGDPAGGGSGDANRLPTRDEVVAMLWDLWLKGGSGAVGSVATVGVEEQ